MSSEFSADSLPDLSGRVYLVSRGNAGIATVAGLASRGAKVGMGARNETKALAAIDEVRAQLPLAAVKYFSINLSSLASVVAAARELKSKEADLHGQVNNAGIMGVPFAATAEGDDVQLQTNCISHWLLTHHLLPLSATSDPTEVPRRIVHVTSDGHAASPPKSGLNLPK